MILRVSPDEAFSEDKKLNKKKESSEIIRAFFMVELEGVYRIFSQNLTGHQTSCNQPFIFFFH